MTKKIYILPGFEFTATFGFHIIALFAPEKPVREIEHLLLSLNIPSDLLDEGSATVGATTDVITVYRMIKQAGGITIAAHANSSNGVAMRGFNFGGQTKIAYTQDANLDALGSHRSRYKRTPFDCLVLSTVPSLNIHAGCTASRDQILTGY